MIEELKTLIKKENDLKLDEIEVNNVPIWRVVRFSFRSKYLKKIKFTNNTKKKKINFLNILKSYLSSKKELLKVKQQQKENIIFAFPRLTKIDEAAYLDKFTDPLIEQTFINDSYLVFQRPLSGVKLKPRLNSEYIYHTDAIAIDAILLAPFNMIKLFFKDRGKINKLISLISKDFNLSKVDVVKMYFKLAVFFNKVKTFKKILSSIQSKRIFLVNREVFSPAIVAAKALGITVFELQHGVTLNTNVLYSGIHNKTIDPDYFLTFGKNSKAEYFSMPATKLINIGHAYIPYLKNKIQPKNKTDVTSEVLFISSPYITESLFLIIKKLSNKHKKVNFVVRLHPQEGLSNEQKELINNTNNICLDNMNVDSFVSLLKYDKVIGHRSSVLFEALTLNKTVLRLNFDEFQNTPADDGFYYANSFKELSEFITTEKEKKEYINNTYSNFCAQQFEKTIKNI